MAETVYINLQQRRDTDNNIRTNDNTHKQGENEIAYDALYSVMHDGVNSSNDLPRNYPVKSAAVSANTTYTAAHNISTIYVTAGSSADVTATLPDAATVPNKPFTIYKIDTGTKNAVVATTAGTINGKTTYAMSEQYQWVKVRSDGTNYIVESQSDLYTRLSDNDISATSTETTIANMKAIPYGQPFLISWFDGDGSDDHTITGVTTETINGIDADAWKGEGTGYWKLVQTADEVFELLNDGEIWDSDGGKFTGEWGKNLSGVLCENGGIVLTASPTSGTFDIAFSATPKATGKCTLEAAVVGSVGALGRLNPTSATAYNIYGYASSTGGAITTGTMLYDIKGRWTDLFPRKS